MAEAAISEPTQTFQPKFGDPSQAHWDLAFLGMVVYMIIEYTRLPYMYPVLESFHVSKIAAGITAVGLLIAPRFRVKSPRLKAIDVGLMFFFLASFVSCFFASYSSAAWNALSDALKWGVVYFLISRIVNNTWRARVFVLILLLLNFKLAQAGVRAFLEYGDVNVGGVRVAMISAVSTDFFGNTNDFGTAMAIVWPLAGILLIGEKKKFYQLMMLMCFVGVFGGMLVSGCRGALMGAAAAVLTGFFRSRRKMGAIFMGVLIAIGILVLLPKGNYDRLVSGADYEQDQTASFRINLWKEGLKMFEDHPVFGVGIGNFAPNYRDHYWGDDPHPMAWAPHNIFIQGLSETGLMGAIPLFAVFVLALSLNGKSRKLLLDAGYARRSFEVRLALGLELSLVSFFVSGFFLTILYYPHLWFLLGISAGYHRACVQMNRDAKAGEDLPAENRGLEMVGPMEAFATR